MFLRSLEVSILLLGLSSPVYAVTGTCLEALRVLAQKDGNRLNSDFPIATLNPGEKVKLSRNVENGRGGGVVVAENYTVVRVELYSASRTLEKNSYPVEDIYLVDPDSGRVVRRLELFPVLGFAFQQYADPSVPDRDH